MATVYDPQDYPVEIIHSHIQVKTSSEEVTFQTKFSDVLDKYRLPNVSSNKLVHAWNSSQMQFWQNQTNFGSSVSTYGHSVTSSSNTMEPVPISCVLPDIHNSCRSHCSRITCGNLSTTHITDKRMNEFVTSSSSSTLTGV